MTADLVCLAKFLKPSKNKFTLKREKKLFIFARIHDLAQPLEKTCACPKKLNFPNSLTARNGFIQPFFTKDLNASVCKSDKIN